MTHRYAFALVISLAAAPVAAQPPVPAAPPPVEIAPAAKPVRPVPVEKAPVDPGPMIIGPLVPGSADLGPLGLGPQLPLEGPLETLPTLPQIATPFVYEAKALADGVRVDLQGVLHETRALVDHLAFEFHQDSRRDREAERGERERDRELQLYNEGYGAALDSRYDRAIGYFNRVIDLKGGKLDAALYWKAYSQHRLGQQSDALSTLAELSKASPNSTYRKHAAALEAQVRRDIGQPVRVQDSTDDEVKLMALAALQHTAPEEAVPMLEKVLEGTASPKVKQRALFVLAQSKSPRARDVLRSYAKGASTPELQSQAIQYLGVHGGPEHRALLEEIYKSTTEFEIKRRILRAFMQANDKDRVLKAAQSEQTPELRAEAVTLLGHMNAHDELWQLYQKEASIDVKRRILRSMQAGGSVDRLIELAKTEQNPELRREAVRALGVMRATRTGDALVQIYAADTSVDVRKAVVNALFVQENATALVALARKEQDSTLKKELVSRLSHMRNKVATDYMIELLGK